MTATNQRDADRLELLDRISDRVPELDLDGERIEWTTLDDGAEALIVNGGGFDGGDGAFLVNHGDDLHAVGTLDRSSTAASAASRSSRTGADGSPASSATRRRTSPSEAFDACHLRVGAL